MTPYYEDDLVTLYHGDCREVTEWLAADVLVTDPPYGIGWTGNFRAYSGTQIKRRESVKIAGDTSTECRDAMLRAWGERPALVFGSWRLPRPERTTNRLIWHKQGMNPGPIRRAFMAQDEEIYVLGSGWKQSAPPLRSVLATTEERGSYAKSIGHPTPKPLGLMSILIDRCPPGSISDPFSGSGATLVAAKQLGRRAVGIEIDERYCEIAARRLAQDTLFGGAA